MPMPQGELTDVYSLPGFFGNCFARARRDARSGGMHRLAPSADPNIHVLLVIAAALIRPQSLSKDPARCTGT